MTAAACLVLGFAVGWATGAVWQRNRTLRAIRSHRAATAQHGWLGSYETRETR